jgi:hypothetical protein
MSVLPAEGPSCSLPFVLPPVHCSVPSGNELSCACALLPGSEIAGEAAAALSAAAIMYKKLGVKRATGAYITHAKQLYNLAVGAQGSYADANPRSCLGIHKVLALKKLLPNSCCEGVLHYACGAELTTAATAPGRGLRHGPFRHNASVHAVDVGFVHASAMGWH